MLISKVGLFQAYMVHMAHLKFLKVYSKSVISNYNVEIWAI